MQIQATDGRNRFWSFSTLIAFRAFVETMTRAARREEGSVGTGPIGNPDNVAPLQVRPIRKRRRAKQHVREIANSGITVAHA
jgi:hypothetical protein